MAIRNIVKEGDPILNKGCRPVTTFDDRLATLLDDMHETMIAADGVGLAGPQVGMLRRLFVVWDTTDAPEEIPEDYEYKFIDFVNPEILAVSEEEETAFEKWVGEHFGQKAEDALLACAAVVGGLLAILLFTVLPTLIVGGVSRFVTLGRWGKVVLEAVLKVAIFLTYMAGISKMKEIHRVFEYHGAEHKTIACYEAGDELTVENVRKYTRFHPRCGTSFLILVVIVSVFLYSVLPWSSTSLRVVFKLLLLPVVMGISYELLKWCGRSDNLATRIIRQPGLWVQRLTVFEPDDSMIEVAIAAVTPVLPEDPEDGKW